MPGVWFVQGSKGSSDVTSSRRLWSAALCGLPGLFEFQEAQGPEEPLAPQPASVSPRWSLPPLSLP